MDKHEMYCAGHMIEAGSGVLSSYWKAQVIRRMYPHDRSYDEPIRSGKKTLGTGT